MPMAVSSEVEEKKDAFLWTTSKVQDDPWAMLDPHDDTVAKPMALKKST